MREYPQSRIILLLTALLFFSLVVTMISRAEEPDGIRGRKNGPHRLYYPFRLAFSPGGNLLVSDPRLGKIVTVDGKSLKAVRCFPVEGKPLGVAYAKGRIFVGNKTKRCIEVYTQSGKKRYNIGSRGSIRKPTDIAVDTEADLLFVVDVSDKNVKVFSTKGTFIGSIPTVDPGNLQLTTPTAVAVDAGRGEVYVSDYGDDSLGIAPRVQIFDYNGFLLDTISGEGNGGGGMGMGIPSPRFSRPQGLAVDGAGHLFLLDCFAGEILVFDRDSGEHLETLGGYGTDPGQLQLPLDIIFHSKTKDLYVTNNRAASVEVFKKGGQL